jgi:putative transposase
MTRPQQRLPGATWFITAVCERRECRLAPDEETTAAIAVAVFDGLDRHGVRLVALSVPGNHMHIVVWDPLGRVSEAMRDVKSVIARYCNTRDEVRGWAVWDRQQSMFQVLGDAQAVVDKVAYTIANPTTSFLVPRPEAWTGAQTPIETLGTGRGRVYRRPAKFFRADGRSSEWGVLAPELPPMVERAYGVAGFQRRVRARVEELVAKAHAEARESGRGFVGIEAVLARGVWHRPENAATKRKVGRQSEPLRRVSASTKRRTTAMARALAVFREAHRAAWEAMRMGLRVMFPAGTYKAWRWYGAMRAEGTPRAWVQLPGS